MKLLNMISKAFLPDLAEPQQATQPLPANFIDEYKKYNRLLKKEKTQKSRLDKIDYVVKAIEKEKTEVRQRIDTFFTKERHLPLIEVYKFINLYKEGLANSSDQEIEELLIKYTKNLPLYPNKDYMEGYAKVTDEGFLLVAPSQFPDSSGVPIKVQSGL
jgi:hypothetical protein